MANKIKIPPRIYLQWFGDAGEWPTNYREITWCRDQISDSDIEYKLVSSEWRGINAAQEAELAALRRVAAYTIETLNQIQEMAAEDIRTGVAEKTSIYQIEAEARVAAEKLRRRML